MLICIICVCIYFIKLVLDFVICRYVIKVRTIGMVKHKMFLKRIRIIKAILEILYSIMTCDLVSGIISTLEWAWVLFLEDKIPIYGNYRLKKLFEIINSINAIKIIKSLCYFIVS